MRENIGLYRAKPKRKGDYYLFSQNWKNSCKDGFVYGSLVIAHDKYYICVSALCQINCCVNNGVASMIEVIPETVGQYTGLTDKNGKKIFEGDVVQYRAERTESYIRIERTIVKYSNTYGYFCVRDRLGTEYLLNAFPDKVVVDNIHDNKLEVGENAE